jgi:hypothetical protein
MSFAVHVFEGFDVHTSLQQVLVILQGVEHLAIVFVRWTVVFLEASVSVTGGQVLLQLLLEVLL